MDWHLPVLLYSSDLHHCLGCRASDRQILRSFAESCICSYMGRGLRERVRHHRHVHGCSILPSAPTGSCRTSPLSQGSFHQAGHLLFLLANGMLWWLNCEFSSTNRPLVRHFLSLVQPGPSACKQGIGVPGYQCWHSKPTVVC